MNNQELIDALEAAHWALAEAADAFYNREGFSANHNRARNAHDCARDALIKARRSLSGNDPTARADHYCSSHGPQPPDVWACPRCVHELRLAAPLPAAAAAWNEQADPANQWDSLGADEKLEWLQHWDTTHSRNLIERMAHGLRHSEPALALALADEADAWLSHG